jgi:hypothetical protein
VTKRDSAYIQKKGEREGIGVRERGGEGRGAGREGSGGRVTPPRMALRSYAGWLAEKARDKAVVAAAGWVDLYVVRVEGCARIPSGDCCYCCCFCRYRCC